jgi:thiamine-phosphate pyrophosphorylase
VSAPRLIAITDTQRAPRGVWLERLEPLCARAKPGSLLVQLRDRELEARERLAFGAALRELTRRHAQLLGVNDRLDLALLLDADAVHLPADGLDVGTTRRFLQTRSSRQWFISEACHAAGDIAHSSADASVLSPICEERKGRPALGLAGLEHALRARRENAGRRCLVYALGGVTAQAAAELSAAGADGVAAIGAVLEPRESVALVTALGIER